MWLRHLQADDRGDFVEEGRLWPAMFLWEKNLISCIISLTRYRHPWLLKLKPLVITPPVALSLSHYSRCRKQPTAYCAAGTSIRDNLWQITAPNWWSLFGRCLCPTLSWFWLGMHPAFLYLQVIMEEIHHRAGITGSINFNTSGMLTIWICFRHSLSLTLITLVLSALDSSPWLLQFRTTSHKCFLIKWCLYLVKLILYRKSERIMTPWWLELWDIT